MKVSYDQENVMTFEQDNDNEKVFAFLGTKFGDGENFSALVTEDELDKLGLDLTEWDKDIKKLQIGETATYGYWFYDKANIIVRLA